MAFGGKYLFLLKSYCILLFFCFFRTTNFQLIRLEFQFLRIFWAFDFAKNMSLNLIFLSLAHFVLLWSPQMYFFPKIKIFLRIFLDIGLLTKIRLKTKTRLWSKVLSLEKTLVLNYVFIRSGLKDFGNWLAFT